jgi:hypothetical protein
VQGSLTDADRDFLLSVKGRRPDWSLLDLPGIDKLPSVQWKLHNLNRMSDDKHQMSLAQLEAVIADSMG